MKDSDLHLEAESMISQSTLIRPRRRSLSKASYPRDMVGADGLDWHVTPQPGRGTREAEPLMWRPNRILRSYESLPGF